MTEEKPALDYEAMAEAVVLAWEIAEGTSVRDGFRHTLVRLIREQIRSVAEAAREEERRDAPNPVKVHSEAWDAGWLAAREAAAKLVVASKDPGNVPYALGWNRATEVLADMIRALTPTKEKAE